MKHLLKFLLKLVLAIVVLLGLVMALSPVVKYAINTHGMDIIGREMQVDGVLINPYTGSVVIKDFHIKETNGETDFVSWGELNVRVNYMKLLGKELDFRHIYLTDMTGQVLNGGTYFNFSDILERFQRDTTDNDTTQSTWSINMDNIRITNGHLVYRDVVRDKQWSMDNLNIEVPGFYIGSLRQSNAGVRFDLPEGGNIYVTAGYRMASRRFAFTLNMDQVNSDVALPFVEEKLGVTALGALVSGKVHIDGCLDNINDVSITSNLGMKGLRMPFRDKDQVVSADSIALQLTNAKLSTLRADNLMVKLMDVTYEDKSMSKTFEYKVENLTIEGDHLRSGLLNDLHMTARLQNGGTMKVDYQGGLNLKQGNHAIHAKLLDVPLTDFTAYTESYMACPIEDGQLAYESHTVIIEGQLSSHNNVNITNPVIGRKQLLSKAKYKNIPLKMGVNLLKSAKGVIIMEIPVTGDISSPKFNFRKVIGRAVAKVFFGPLMSVKDNRKMISRDEAEEMMEILTDDLDVDADSLAAAVAVSADRSVVLPEVTE